MDTHVPTHPALDLAVAFAEATGFENLFGAGNPDDPLFPIEVRLSQTDGNSFAVTAVVERAVKAYLRAGGMARQQAEPVWMALRRELWSSEDYSTFLTKVRCLVQVT